MKKFWNISLIALSWLMGLLVLPILFIDFFVPVLFDDPQFWHNRILLIMVLLLFVYPFLMAWAAVRSKLARKKGELGWASFFLLFPVVNILAMIGLFNRAHQVEMDKVLVLVKKVFENNPWF